MNEESAKELIKFGCKVISVMKIVTLVTEEAPTNFVPAVAVIRNGLTLFRITGCKTCVDYYCYVED